MKTSEFSSIARGFLGSLPAHISQTVKCDEPLSSYTSLRVGGPADLYYRALCSDDLAIITATAQRLGLPYFLLGGGSNVCISDKGIRGLVIHNACENCEIGEITRVDSGYPFMQLFLKTAEAGFTGLEFAVGIPGTVGGALVSNAGAYRQNISDLVIGLDVVENGERMYVNPEWMGFSYRDSRLRRGGEPATVITVSLQLKRAERIDIMSLARENQNQRIYKQPWYPSAGSFFKNIDDRDLADRLPDLPVTMKLAGVVPAGYINSACGLKGLTVGGAELSTRHANFIINRGEATASDIRNLAQLIKQRVYESYGVTLQEEALYVGDWE